jgi:hypothetical protein
MTTAATCGRVVFHRDSVPEIIVEGETGFIVEDIDRAVEAVGKIEQNESCALLPRIRTKVH